MATLQGKAVKNTYRQVLQIGANNVGVSGTLQPVQDGAGINTALSLSTTAATINGTLTITGDLIITGGGIQIQDLIDDTVASLIQNGTGITWAYNDTLRTLTPTITIATADGGVQGDFMQFNVNAGEANAVAKIYWNSTDGTADLGLMGGQVILPIGQKQVVRVLNNSGSIFNKSAYQVVKIAPAQGQRLAVTLAQANNDANSTDTLGLVAENIANNQEGFITSSGLITGVDTTGDLQLEDWNDGDILYLSPTTPGAITKVKPIAPQHSVIVGFVVYAHKTQGKIFVKVDNGYELDELHNVRITNVANNNVLRYNSSLAVWENVAPLTTWITEGTNLYYTQGRFDSAFAAKSTTNLAEGTNLYFTTARGNANFATNLAASTTTNLAEGTNLYFTNQRFDSRFGTKTTTDLAEGTNLYYTQARFNTAFDAKTTTDLDEGTNLYYTDARARAAISENAVGLDYSSGSGVLSLTAGYAIPTTVKLGDYDTAYNRSIVSAAVTGTGTKTLSLTQQDANVITATWTDQGITTINGTANQIAATTVGNTTTLAFTNDVTMPNNLVVSGNLTINGTATYVNTQAISAKDPLFEVANDNNTTDAVDIGYYGRYFDSAQTRVEFTGLFRDASDAGKFKFFTGLTVEPTNVVDTTGTGYTIGTLVANVEGNLAGTANAANVLSTARSISATGDAAWTVNFDGSANATGALTLTNTGVTATTYGTSTSVPTIAVDGKGRITSASNTAINFPVTSVNSLSGNVVLTTSNVAEGTNQYFTTGRVAAYLTGAISTVLTTDLTASRAVASNASGKLVSSATTDTELGYLSGVTSAVQTQLNGKQATLTNPVTGTGTSNTLPKFNGTSTITNSLLTDNAVELRYTGADGIRIQGSTDGFMTIYGTSTNYLQFADADGSPGSIRYNHTNNSMIFKANGSDALTIASTGDTTFTGDINLFKSGSNRILYVSKSDGTSTIQLNSNGASIFNGGNVLIGTTTDTGHKLRVFGASGTIARITDGTNNLDFYCGSGLNEIAATTSLLLSTNGTPRLTIASTGAATFSSSVTANGLYANAGNSARFYRGANDFYWGVNNDSNNYLNFGTFAANGTAYGTNPKMILLDNGNVGIGTSDVTNIGANYTALNINGASGFGAGIILKVNNVLQSQLYVENALTTLNIANGAYTITGSFGTAFRIASNGNVGIGTSSPIWKLHTNTTSGSNVLLIQAPSTDYSEIYFGRAATGSPSYAGYIQYYHVNDSMAFGTNATERMRITSAGYLKLREATSSTTEVHILRADTTSDAVAQVVNANTSTTSDGMFAISASRNTTNNTFYALGYYNAGASAWKFRVADSGNVTNTNNSYGAISDIKLKENITDATPKLDDLLKVKIKNFNYIGSEEKQLGVIAQELQEVFPGMIEQHQDYEEVEVTDEEGNTTTEKQSLGTVTKSVKYSVFVPMLIKAIQELEARVKELEAK